MKQYLDFFDPKIGESIASSLKRAYDAGARTALLLGTTAPERAVIDAVQAKGLSWTERQLSEFRGPDCADVDLVLVTGGSSTEVSQALHACIGAEVSVLAPVTAHHFSKRTLYLMSIPKAGTHMIIRLLGLMGLERSPDRVPLPGTWCTPVGYEYHAPCRMLMANDWFYPVGRQLLFRSPAIFAYRNPLDIIVSERDWFVKPEHAFSGYLNCFADQSEQLARLIADQSVMGNIRDRINRYSGWMNFENVIPVSYEELVGSAGGGSDDEQQATIWSLQLKLHIPGSPEKYGSQLYDPTGTTFFRGKIGRYADCFTERHFALFNELSQDFMHALGYRKDVPLSVKVEELRHRPLKVKEIPEDILYTARLVREGISGFNVVEIAGRYYPIPQGKSIMSSLDARDIVDRLEGFITTSDALDVIYRENSFNFKNSDKAILSNCNRSDPPYYSEPILIETNYLGYNIVGYKNCYYAVDTSLGDFDLQTTDIGDYTKEQKCIIAASIDDAKIIVDKIRTIYRLSAESELKQRENERLALELESVRHESESKQGENERLALELESVRHESESKQRENERLALELESVRHESESKQREVDKVNMDIQMLKNSIWYKIDSLFNKKERIDDK